MSNARRGALTLVAALAVALGVTACGGGSDSGGGKTTTTAGGGTPAPKALKVGLIFNTATDPNQQGEAKGFEDAAKALGWEVNKVDANNDAAKANDVMRQMTSEGVDAIVTIVWPPAALQSGIRAANDAKVPVFMMNAFGQPDGVAGVISQTAAKQETEQMLSDLGDKGAVLAFTFRPGEPCVVAEQAFDEAMKAHPDVKVTKQEVPAPGWEQAGAKAASTWLQSHPKGSGPLAIWGCWDGPNIGAVSALRQAGRTDVKVYGQYGEAAALKLIKDGTYTATFWFDQIGMGKQMVDIVRKHAEDGDAAQPVFTSMDPTLVTADTIGAFLQEHPEALPSGN